MRAAKLPGPETGIEIRRTMCDNCTPGPQCGVDAYVKDGVVVKLEGTAGFPGSDGRLCVKGAAGRQYLYRADRIRSPMKRTGPRGSGACVRACPVSAPVLGPDGKMHKCDGCADRVKRGLLPACVRVCPMDALQLTRTQ